MLMFIIFGGLSIFIRTIFKFETNILAMKINRGVSSLLFQKITRMSQVSLAKASAGKLVTMVSGELQTMESSMWYILSMYTYIIVLMLLFGYFAYIFYEASVIGFVGMIIFIVIFLMTIPCLKKWRYMEATFSDLRIQYLTDIINGIKTIKAY